MKFTDLILQAKAKASQMVVEDTVLGQLADVALLVVYGAVIGYFGNRFLERRKLASLGVMLLPTGWIYTAVIGLNIINPSPYGIIRWVGVGFGIFLLYTLWKTDKKEKEKKQQLPPTT